MSYLNTVENYGRIARWLHWGTAFLFLLAYCAVYYRHWFTTKADASNLISLHIHLSAGVSVGVIVFLRIVWRNMNIQPVLEPGPRWQHLLAHSAHYALYAIMILMPVSGYIGTGVETEFFYLFQIPKFEDTWLFQTLVWDLLNMEFKEFEKPVDFFHKDIMGAWLVWMLIIGHGAAAVYHHYKLNDRTLLKMTG